MFSVCISCGRERACGRADCIMGAKAWTAPQVSSRQAMNAQLPSDAVVALAVDDEAMTGMFQDPDWAMSLEVFD